MRGKPGDAFASSGEIGITPAHAGKTGQSPDAPRPKRDHPRACGENLPALSKTYHRPGSPPRMRGKHLEKTNAIPGVGITPAHAGKTHRAKSGTTWTWDHPRACGENSAASAQEVRVTGSPPRMRGKQPHRAET